MEHISDKIKADILVQAIPYMQKYRGKTIVIKYGGNAMVNEAMKKSIIEDVAWLFEVGINVVLVHGGGPEINAMLKKLNIESKFIDGLRYTDRETMNVVQMVLSGKINKELACLLGEHNVQSMGICGLDNCLIRAKKRDDKDYGYVGEITFINTDILKDALNANYVPVVATIGISETGETLNINADTAAAQIAIALGAEKFILLTDVKGVLRDQNDENSLITELDVNQVEQLKESGVIKGGMIPKVDCAVLSVANGVKSASIVDGRVEHAILIEIFSVDGKGTMIKK